MGSPRQLLGLSKYQLNQASATGHGWLCLGFPVHLRTECSAWGICLQGRRSAAIETGSWVIRCSSHQAGGPFLWCPTCPSSP